MKKFDNPNPKNQDIKDEEATDNQILINKEVKKRKIDKALLQKHME